MGFHLAAGKTRWPSQSASLPREKNFLEQVLRGKNPLEQVLRDAKALQAPITITRTRVRRFNIKRLRIVEQ